MIIRINLLPPEIVQRRRAEERILWAVLAAILVGAALTAVLGFTMWRVEAKKSDLAGKQQEAASLQLQAERFKIFETKQQDLSAREAIANEALAGRVNWSRMCSELSLVLPGDVWLKDVAFDEEKGITFNGWAVDSASDTPDSGHKSIAKLLVRLADLEQLDNVWLTSSEKSSYEEQPAISFAVRASVQTTAGAGAPGALPPAPGAGTQPSQQGQAGTTGQTGQAAQTQPSQ